MARKKMAVKKHVLAALAWVALLSCSTGVAVAASETTPIRVTLRLLSTSEGGPTSVTGATSRTFDVGESGSLFAVAGQLHEDAGQCGIMISGGHRTDETITTRIRNEFATALDGDGYFWEVRVALEDVEPGSAKLNVNWTRSGELAGEREIFERSFELHIPFGSHRVLETVPFELPTEDSTCRTESYYLELEVGPTAHASMANQDLAYELWFARTRDGRREEFAATEILAGQAEDVRFSVPPLRQTINGVRSADGSDITLKTQCKGRIRAWSTGPDTLTIQVDPALHHRLGAPLESGFSSGKGSKLYEAILGETVEFELPPVYARLTLPPGGVILTEPGIAGVELNDSGLSLDFGQLLGDTHYSLLVRVKAAD